MSTLNQMGFVDENDNETVYDLEDSAAQASILAIEGKIPSNASSSNKMATASDITDINNKIPSNASSSNKLVTQSDVSSTYHHAGTKTVAELTSALLIAANEGNVYNMTDSGTASSDFIESDIGKPIDVGDNVGVAKVGNTYKFDLLSGFTDTSNLQPKTLDTSIDVDGTTKTTVESALQAINTLAAGVKTAVGSLSSLTTTVKTSIVAAINELVISISTINGKIPSGASSSNKMATASDVTGLQDNVIANTKLIKDTVGWSGKNRYNNANTNGKPGSVLTKTDTGFRCVVSTDSTWNGATNELRCSANVGFILSLDTAITSGITYITVAGSTDGSTYTTITNSSILTTSGSVNLEFNTGNYTYLRISFFTTNNDIKTCDVTISNIMLRDADILDDTYEPYHSNVVNTLRDAEVIQGKNLLENKGVQRTVNGITFTVNSDGSITVNGTATANITDYFVNTNFSLKAGKYKCNGNPTGTTGFVTGLRISDPTYTTINYFFENELDLTINEDISNLRVDIRIGSGATFNNVVFKPMIRLATETDPTYEPYYVPLKDSMFRREEQRVLGAKNLLYNNLNTETLYGITYTRNADETWTINGTANDNSWKVINNNFKLPVGKYIFSGCPKGGSSNSYKFLIREDPQVTGGFGVYDLGEGAILNITNEIAQKKLVVFIGVSPNTTVSNLVFKPMIRLASDPDDTYVPFAMTNRELTVVNNREEIILDLTGISTIKGMIEAVFTNSIPLLTSNYQKASGVIRVGGLDAYGFFVHRISNTTYRALLYKESYIYTALSSNGTVTAYSYEGTVVS